MGSKVFGICVSNFKKVEKDKAERSFNWVAFQELGLGCHHRDTCQKASFLNYGSFFHVPEQQHSHRSPRRIIHHGLCYGLTNSLVLRMQSHSRGSKMYTRSCTAHTVSTQSFNPRSNYNKRPRSQVVGRLLSRQHVVTPGNHFRGS